RLVELSKQHPKIPAIWNNLGNIYQNQNDWPNAITSYTRALALQPEHHSARFNLALCLQKLGRAQEACQYLRPIIEQGLADENAWGLWVQALRQLHQYSGAQSALDVALRRHPKSAHLWLQQGALFEQQKRWQEALSAYQRAVPLQPELHLAWSQLAYLQATNGEWTALAHTLGKLKQLVAEGSTDISPFVLLALTDDPELHYRAARQWSQRYAPYADTRPAPSRRQHLTIAYLSADFYQHPTAFLAASLFEHHDRQRFRVLAYSNSPDDKSDMRKRLENAFDAFYDIRHWSVPEIVSHIQSQQVDILIDLKGHTEDALLEVLAQRPAPLQLTYLGYPGTTGAPFIDSVIADSVVLPEQLTPHFSEHPIRLNHCYQVNDVKRPRPQTHMPRSVFGFRDEDVVLACFNNSWKISKAMLECWLRILQAAPNTRLWLMDRNPSSRFQSNVRRAVRAHGLDESRVSFAMPRPYEEYLRYYLRVDLMLDTFPYNAHTMTSDALWMACPVLTLEGRTFAAR
ncbi:MAG: tetratricopeptide repeat protein, partial [Gammaproteobacteria bacterium]